MLAKRTVESLITRSSAVKNCADEVRARLAQLSIEEQDVAAALSWARQAERIEPTSAL